jgi:hypothetical protein
MKKKPKKKTNQSARAKRFIRWITTHPCESVWPSCKEIEKKVESLLYVAYLEGRKDSRAKQKSV